MAESYRRQYSEGIGLKSNGGYLAQQRHAYLVGGPEQTAGISVRDAVHAAVMMNRRVESIATFDRGF